MNIKLYPTRKRTAAIRITDESVDIIVDQSSKILDHKRPNYHECEGVKMVDKELIESGNKQKIEDRDGAEQDENIGAKIKHVVSKMNLAKMNRKDLSEHINQAHFDQETQSKEGEDTQILQMQTIVVLM